MYCKIAKKFGKHTKFLTSQKKISYANRLQRALQLVTVQLLINIDTLYIQFLTIFFRLAHIEKVLNHSLFRVKMNFKNSSLALTVCFAH